MKYINDFLNYLKVIKKSSSYTIENYQRDLLDLYDYTNDLIDISHEIVSSYLEYLYSRGLNRNSISRKLSAIRSFYQYLEKEGIIKHNYFREISNPKRAKSLPKYVKDNDLEKMFNCFDMKTPLGMRNALVLEMLYATGIRVSELVGICLDDINYYDHTIKILGKGMKERIVIYGSFCASRMDLYLNYGREKLSCGKGSKYLFLNKNGGQLSSRYIRKIIDEAVSKCEIEYHISPHTLRHTFATDMLREGADLMSVKQLLGHTSVNTTSIYTHVTNDQIKKVYTFAHPRSIDRDEKL